MTSSAKRERDGQTETSSAKRERDGRTETSSAKRESDGRTETDNEGERQREGKRHNFITFSL